AGPVPAWSRVASVGYTPSPVDAALRCVGFFFQAEDGIRDRNVTGVQTCALPILQRPAAQLKVVWLEPQRLVEAAGLRAAQGQPRSEERRVGKECRCRWARDA